MKGTRSKTLAACLAVAAGSTFAGNAAFAQEYVQQTQQITVVAPLHPLGPSETPDRVYFSQAVSFADLDLRTDRGAQALSARVDYAAEENCRMLDRYYQDSMPIAAKASRKSSCVSEAVYRAQPQVTAVVFAARQ